MKLSPLPTVSFDVVLWLGRRVTETPDWLGEAIARRPETTGAVFRWRDELHVWTPDGKAIALTGDALLYAGGNQIYVIGPGLFTALFAGEEKVQEVLATLGPDAADEYRRLTGGE